ncbi:hypothetical protein TWF506_004730 [Arthrobotrys conoides]|uniref:Uncharacterized protein n=1 Tax=Arthrobotrys conoides TaxID=74498 RepID=A0AAN8RI36_9PEZI
MWSQKMLSTSRDQNEDQVGSMHGATKFESGDTGMPDTRENSRVTGREESEEEGDVDMEYQESGGDGYHGEVGKDAKEAEEKAVDCDSSDEMVMEDLKIGVSALDIDGDNDMWDLMGELRMGEEKEDNIEGIEGRKEEVDEQEEQAKIRGPGRERGWAYFHGQWSPNLHVSTRLLMFNLYLTDEEVKWCQNMMVTRSGGVGTYPLSVYVREGIHDLKQRISDIGKMIIDSGAGQHPRYFQFQVWVSKLANSIGQIATFAENFDLRELLGCDKKTSQLPLTSGEVLALLYAYGKNFGTGVDQEIKLGLDILIATVIFDALPIPAVDPEIVSYFLEIARRSSKRQNGSGFGPWGQVDIQTIDFSGDHITKFGTVDRSLTANEELNAKVKPAELLTMVIVKASYPVPSRIKQHFPGLAVSLVSKGLECKIERLKRRRGKNFFCKASVRCAGFGFNHWTATAKALSTETVVKRVAAQLQREIDLAYFGVHLT